MDDVPGSEHIRGYAGDVQEATVRSAVKHMGGTDDGVRRRALAGTN